MTAEEMWCRFTAEQDVGDAGYTAWAFGGEADTLAELVCRGEKTGTASLAYWYRDEGEPMPAVGAYSVILNAAEEAVCVIRTTRVYVVPFLQVSEEHAWKEGEGDRTLAYWRAVHQAFFAEELRVIGQTFSEEMDVVCEEFQVVFQI